MRNLFSYISSRPLWMYIIAPVVLAVMFAWMFLYANGRGLVTVPPTAYAQTGWSYITLSPYYVLPGQTFSVNGDGFMPNENVTVSTSFGTNVNAKADASGRFTSSSITVPHSAISSTVSVTARGDRGSAGSASLAVGGFYPVVEPSGYYILPGNSVRFSGSRYSPNESVNVFRGNDRIGTVETDNTGSFTTGWIAVGYTAGRQTYTFTGQNSGVSVSRTIMVSGAPSYILLNNYYNYAGTDIRVTGRAFGSSEQVVVRFDNTVLGTTTTNSLGEFTLNGSIPSGAGFGAHTITSQGTQTGLQARATFTVAPEFLRNFGFRF